MDIRSGPAQFYDLNPGFPEDIPFYLGRLPRLNASVLELGCGTGRVSIPLAQVGASVQGIDKSPAMIEILRSKLRTIGVKAGGSIRADVGDITNVALGQRYDFVIAPFRVFQNLDSDEEIDGLFGCVRAHLARGGRCILNAFNPNRPPDRMRKEWCSAEEQLAWRVEQGPGWVACYDRRTRMDGERLVLYPDLIYRRYEGDDLVEEHTLSIPMRCHYPADFEALVQDHGFEVFGKWGGYANEPYGDGGELIIEFGFS